MEFIDTISHKEQKLFTLLFIYHYKRIEGKLPTEEILLIHIPDMTKRAPQNIAKSYMDQILGELVHDGCIQVKATDGGSYYELSGAGQNFLEKNNLLIPSGREPVLSRYLTREDLADLIDGLAQVLDTHISIMDGDNEFRVSSSPVRGICDECVRNPSSVGCICCDLVAARRAKRIGPHNFKCHAGFVECIAPIRLNGDECGCIFLGRIIPRNLDVDTFIQRCSARGAPKKLVEEKIGSAMKSQAQSTKQIETTGNIAAGISILLSALVKEVIDRMRLAVVEKHSDLLLQIADLQNTSSNIEDLLDGVAKKMSQTFNCQACEIILVDVERGGLEVRGVYGSESKGVRYVEGDGSFTGKVASNREIIRLRDIRDFYASEPVPREFLPPGSRLGIPLIYREEFIGVFKLANKRSSPDSPALEFIHEDETTGRIIAYGIARTVREYQERQNVSALLRETDKRYILDGKAESALRYMVENLGKAIAGVWASLYRRDPRENGFIRVAFSTMGGEPPARTKGGHIPKVAKSEQAQYIPDALNSIEHEEILSNSDSSDDFRTYIHTIGSEYAVPLVVGDRLYGVLCFYKAGVDSFAIVDRQAADDLAARASLLLESHRLLRGRERMIKNREKLYNSALRLQRKLRLDELLKEVVTIIAGVDGIGYDRARLYLISSDGERMESAAQAGLEEPENIRRFENRKIVGELGEDREEGIVFHVLKYGQPIIYVRQGSDSHKIIGQRDTEGIEVRIVEKDLHERELEREGIDEWLDVPLIASERHLGKITVDNKWSKRPFLRTDCETLGMFGPYIAQAILNAREIEKIEGFGFGARTLAHDIRGETTTIGLMLDLIQKQTLSDILDQCVQKIRKANNAIIRRIATTQKAICIEDPEPKTVTIQDLKELILNESEMSDPDILVSDISEELLNIELTLDEDLMIGVFLNLMRNSQEAMKGGGKVRISAWLESNYVYLSWQDDGPGIPERNVQDLFTMGFTTKPGGTGTGLYSIRRMLLKSRGDIRFDGKSEKNEKGNCVARFVMKLPRLRSDAEDHDMDHPAREGHDHDNLQ